MAAQFEFIDGDTMFDLLPYSRMSFICDVTNMMGDNGYPDWFLDILNSNYSSDYWSTNVLPPLISDGRILAVDTQCILIDTKHFDFPFVNRTSVAHSEMLLCLSRMRSGDVTWMPREQYYQLQINAVLSAMHSVLSFIYYRQPLTCSVELQQRIVNALHDLLIGNPIEPYYILINNPYMSYDEAAMLAGRIPDPKATVLFYDEMLNNID